MALDSISNEDILFDILSNVKPNGWLNLKFLLSKGNEYMKCANGIVKLKFFMNLIMSCEKNWEIYLGKWTG